MIADGLSKNCGLRTLNLLQQSVKSFGDEALTQFGEDIFKQLAGFFSNPGAPAGAAAQTADPAGAEQERQIAEAAEADKKAEEEREKAKEEANAAMEEEQQRRVSEAEAAPEKKRSSLSGIDPAALAAKAAEMGYEADAAPEASGEAEEKKESED